MATALTRLASLVPRNSGKDRGDRARQGFLCFVLGHEEFGVDLQLVRQVVKPPPVTRVPRAPEHILGVVSIRGTVVTLIDLGLLMGFGATGWPRGVRILLIEVEGELVGLLVDRVTMVRRLPESALERNPSLEESPHSARVVCLARTDECNLVTVIDLEGLVAEALEP
jgi:purine-binding chemotaxis protein CheW